VATLLAGRGADDPLAALTGRERTVLQLMAEGLTNTGIAKRLYLSERTVEAHVRHVLGKLDVPEGEDDHRRVRAVLTHLGATEKPVAEGW
jgi:DNA-binding NarL/FixJ family response regulator